MGIIRQVGEQLGGDHGAWPEPEWVQRSAVEGATQRLKVHIRWYGDIYGVIQQLVLELKRKRGFVGSKDSFPLDFLPLDPDMRARDLSTGGPALDLPESLQIYLHLLSLLLINRYWSRHFLLADGRFRVTIETELAFHGCSLRPDVPNQ